MNDYSVFIFKSTFRHYIVPAECESEAWAKFASRQSMSIKNCKKQYVLKTFINHDSGIVKI